MDDIRRQAKSAADQLRPPKRSLVMKQDLQSTAILPWIPCARPFYRNLNKRPGTSSESEAGSKIRTSKTRDSIAPLTLCLQPNNAGGNIRGKFPWRDRAQTRYSCHPPVTFRQVSKRRSYETNTYCISGCDCSLERIHGLPYGTWGWRRHGKSWPKNPGQSGRTHALVSCCQIRFAQP